MDQIQNEKPEEDQTEFEPPKPIKLNDSLHSFELYRDYTPPDWSGHPTKSYFLEILKNGVIIGQQDLSSKPLYLVGKLPDLCDIVLEHPSISRKHAVFQHRNDGTMFLYDLGSTHGVKVNKRDIQKNTFHKLNLGDVIKFGQSSRLFIVGIDGKTTVDDYDDGQAIAEAQALRDAPITKKEVEKLSRKEQYQQLLEQYNLVKKGPKKQLPVETYTGVSWGMVDEALIYAYEDEEDVKLDTDILRQLSDLTPKDIEKIDNYEKKLHKFNNMDRELNELIRREQAEFGLTEEDKQRRNQLESKVTELRSQVEIMEDNLKYQLLDEVKSKGGTAKRREEDTFGDDEFFDRTLVKKHKKDEANDKSKVPETETFETLKNKLEDLLTNRNEINEKILKMVLNLGTEEEKVEEVDALDQFMLQNEENLKKETKHELIQKVKALNVEIEEVQKLLRIVKPGFNFDIKHYEKKLEDKKKAEASKGEAKPAESLNLSQKLESTSGNIAKLIKKDEAPKEETMDSLDDQDEEIAKLKTKPKVYGVAPKPAPRNIKENDYESGTVEDLDWTPPVDKFNAKQEELKKKLGY